MNVLNLTALQEPKDHAHLSHDEGGGAPRNPKYWRDQVPSFIAKVTEGFQRLSGKR